MKIITIILSTILFFSVSTKCNLIKDITRVQKRSLKNIKNKELKQVYKDVLYKEKKKLKILFEELKLREEILSQFKMVETYNVISRRHSGLIWNENSCYSFVFYGAKLELIINKIERDFSDYIFKDDLAIDVIKFLDSVSINFKTSDLPLTKKGGDLFCVFSNVKKRDDSNYNIELKFFRDISPAGATSGD
jgi:hypothetical protein